MAKPFYTLEEVCDVLKKNQDEVKELVRIGRLREFRDAGKIFFKREEVKRIAAKEGAGTLVWVGRFDLVEFAVVLEPDEPLATARREKPHEKKLVRWNALNALNDLPRVSPWPAKIT